VTMVSKVPHPKSANAEQHSELSKLRVTVRHLLDAWPAVLQRRYFLRRMAQSEALRAALVQTYAGHVFNAMHGAMSFDLVRAVGALILDRRRDSSSLFRAVVALRKPTVVNQLRAQVYEPPLVARASAQARAAIQRMLSSEFDAVFARLPADLDEMDRTVLNAPMASSIKEVRDKVVAHAAVEHDGFDWKVWAVGGTKLTYAQLDEYIDACTKAVDKLSHVVLRTAFSFADLPGISQRYADEYIDALVIGLREQKQAKERQREENLRRTQELIAKASTGN
jgi:hypothetical protein